MASSDPPPGSLRAKFAAEKGKLDFSPSQAFLLHVFWEAPNLAAAKELLAGLKKCGVASHRDTPCTVTYFFRLSSNNQDLCTKPPTTVGEHPHLAAAQKKLKMGVPAPAVKSQVAKLGLDPALLDLDSSAPLPAEVAAAASPVAVEFTEVYLDERAFMEHAASRDFLDGYGVVMKPEYLLTPPTTVRVGMPTEKMRETILEPILKEVVAPLVEGCTVWNPSAIAAPSAAGVEAKPEAPLFLSFDLAPGAASGSAESSSDVAAAAVAARLPAAFKERCTTVVAFAHPKREGSVRLMAVLPSLLSSAGHVDDAVLRSLREALEGAGLSKTEVHVAGTDVDAEAVKGALLVAGFAGASTVVTASQGGSAEDVASAGFILHSKAAEVHTTAA